MVGSSMNCFCYFEWFRLPFLGDYVELMNGVGEFWVFCVLRIFGFWVFECREFSDISVLFLVVAKTSFNLLLFLYSIFILRNQSENSGFLIQKIEFSSLKL
jgi:hypothetical protein